MSGSCRRAVVVAGAVLTTAGCVGSVEPTADPANVVEVVGPYRDGEADQVAAILERFTEETGIQTRYTGSADFVSDLTSRLGEGATPPNVGFVPQPGLVGQLVRDGQVVEPGAGVEAELDEHYPPVTRDLGDVDGRTIGVPFRLNVKSLIWYRPDVFEDNGWEIPATLDELEELVNRIEADSDVSPWCLAVRAGGATGWPATDWVEDVVLRRAGPEVYAGWVDGDVTFAASAIARGFEEFSELVLAADRVDGGVSTAVETTTEDVFDGLLADPPGCAMAKQADFAVGWLPSDASVGPDGTVDTFLFPSVAAGDLPPLVVGADTAVAFDQKATTRELMTFLASADVGREWARSGGFISPKATIEPDDYPVGFGRELARTVVAADELVLDASDAMPPSVGTSLYWSSIVEWMTGVIGYDELAATLDEAFEAALADEP